MRKYLAGLLVCLILGLMPGAALAVKPVVYAVLFYNPRCPHCRHVIDDLLPVWQQEFGDQFKLIMVNAETREGSKLFAIASETPGTAFTAFGVPVLIIGNTVILGDVQIEQRLPGLIRDGLARGGIEPPPIPGLQEAAAGELPELTLIQRLALDPIANGAAIGILTASVISVGALLLGWKQRGYRSWVQGNPAWRAALITSLVATSLASTLLAKSPRGAILLTGGITLALLIETAAIAINWRRHQPRRWRNGLIPVGALIGLAVAAYLASMEIAPRDSFCGLVGNCYAVQQSVYARLFGILPVGVLGMVGYLVILVVWLVGRGGAARFVALARPALRATILGGVLFSIYLTFLEPFVIGATCVWCLMSAVIMLLLFWLTWFDHQPAVEADCMQLAG